MVLTRTIRYLALLAASVGFTTAGGGQGLDIAVEPFVGGSWPGAYFHFDHTNPSASGHTLMNAKLMIRSRLTVTFS